MATLTKSTGTVTLSGAVEKVTLPAVYGWVWVKNMSDADMFVGLSDGISAGADGVMRIPAGECGRVQTDGQDSVYLMGTGNALVVAQNYADSPFKAGGKGGEIPDLSAYAKKTDVPDIKVNAAVNADTVNGHSVNADVPENAKFTDTIPDLSPYAKKTDIPTELPANGGNADTVNSLKTDAPNYLDIFSTTLNSSHPCWNKKCSVYGQSNDINAEVYLANAPEIDIAVWYEVETIGNDARAYQIAHGCYIHQRKSFIRYMHDAVWSDWFEIYTSNSKPYVTGSATVAANSQICVTNHGFMPSAAIWWDSNGSNGVAPSFNDSQFIINVISTDERTINYLMFK